MRPCSFIGKSGLSFILIAAVTALAGCGRADKAELEQLRQEHAEVEKLREENARLTEAQASNPELVRLRKENEEVHKLRSEVRQLRDQVTQLAKAADDSRSKKAAGGADAANQATLGQENERLRAELAMVRQTAQVNAQVQSQAAVCINNLRMISTAIDQWAVASQKPPGAPIGPAEVAQITAYLPGNRLPVCPQGGNYSLQAVKIPPTCNIPGHNL